MLTYNILVFVVAALLLLDYYVHKYDVHLQYSGNRMALGNSFVYMALGVMIFFAGFRFEVGYDYQKYLAGYMFDSELKHWEPFFNFFVRLSRNINFGLGIQFMFLFFSAMTIVILYSALRGITQHYRFGLFLYLLVPALFLNSFSTVRQGIAMVILLYGLYYITVEVDRRKYLIFAFIAFMFHYSSIFVVVTYLLFGKLFDKTYSWIVYVFGILISFALYFAHIGKYLLLMLPGHFSTYAKYEIDVSILKLLIVNGFFIFFVLQKQQFVRSRLHRYLLNSMFLAAIIFNVFADFTYVTRIAQYFLIAEIILVPIYLYSIEYPIKRKVLIGLFLVYYLFNFDYALHRDKTYGEGKKHFLVPYKNYFFEEQKSNRNVNIEAWYNYIFNATEEERQGDIQ